MLYLRWTPIQAGSADIYPVIYLMRNGIQLSVLALLFYPTYQSYIIVPVGKLNMFVKHRIQLKWHRYLVYSTTHTHKTKAKQPPIQNELSVMLKEHTYG